jgi:hypothetical protein
MAFHAMNAPKYIRLPGRGRTMSGTSRLYLGNDHILMAQSVGYSESYKRFFFADIQAIIVRKTIAGMVWNGVWGLIAMFFMVLAISVNETPASYVLGGIAAFFVLALLINTALGPMCVCHVRTAVQTERLTAISRLRTANKLIERIRPLIVAAQGEMPRENFNWNFDRAQGFPAESFSGAPPVLG